MGPLLSLNAIPMCEWMPRLPQLLQANDSMPYGQMTRGLPGFLPEGLAQPILDCMPV